MFTRVCKFCYSFNLFASFHKVIRIVRVYFSTRSSCELNYHVLLELSGVSYQPTVFDLQIDDFLDIFECFL